MKTSFIYAIIGLLMINTLSGQVKIGNNPQNLDPASVLELESNTRVLVITRVTDAQMSVINPLPGALAYNTDQECLHYYNGTEWINLCEELDDSFTVSTRADYLSAIDPQARDSTVVISQIENPDGSINYNFEVGRITGANIVDTSINGDLKLQDNSVTGDKLANGSVTLQKLADATTGQPGDLFQWNGTNWTLINESALGITEKDSIVGNEVIGPFDSTLERMGTGNAGDPYTLDVAEGGITDYEIATGAVTTDEILNGTILEADISDDAVTKEKINANVAGTGLSQATDGSLEVDNANIAPDWASITGIPADIDDGDDDTTYSAGLGINIDPSNVISTTNLAGDVTGPINSTTISSGVITNSHIAVGAAIDGSKINPVFTNDVTTTGDFIDLTPDFVFQKYFNGYSSLNNDYEFRSLDEIESFIKENNHLPGIKSAHQIKAQGKYFLTESSMAQLEKIEELFLHTIEQEKKIKKLQSDNQKLTRELDSLKEDMEVIKAMLLENSQN